VFVSPEVPPEVTTRSLSGFASVRWSNMLREGGTWCATLPPLLYDLEQIDGNLIVLVGSSSMKNLVRASTAVGKTTCRLSCQHNISHLGDVVLRSAKYTRQHGKKIGNLVC
jgi:hypothetical protein